MATESAAGTDIPGGDSEASTPGKTSAPGSSSPRNTKERRKAGRPGSASPETRAEIMALLATDDHPPIREIARRYGVAASTIYDWTNAKNDALTAGGQAGKGDSTTSTGAATEAEYRRRTRRALPVKERVRILREIAQGVPMTPKCDAEHVCACGRKRVCGNVLDFKLPVASASERLKALQRADELEGVVTAVQRREAEAAGNVAQPLFALPPGAVLVAQVQPSRPTTGGGLPALPAATEAK